jgi:hypothetical protein
MTTDIDLTSTAASERSEQGRAARRRWRRPLLVAAAAAAAVAGVIAIRAGTSADTQTPAPAVPAEVVAAEPVTPVEPDRCIEHRPC